MTQIVLLGWLASAAMGWSASPYPQPVIDGAVKPVVGQIVSTRISDPNDSLHQVAQRYGVGFDNLRAANPGVDPWLPALEQPIQLPLTTIPPDRLTPGITINLAELRLYHLWQHRDRFWLRVYPIGIGRQGLETPEGDFFIANKVENPSWRVPERIREEDPSLPRIMKPGPENPLGSHWLGLSAASYGLHGTNRPLGIGRRVSSGCIRLYPPDIAELYRTVLPRVPVRIVYDPIKLGVHNGGLYLQVHEDYANRLRYPFSYVLQRAFRIAPGIKINPQWARAIIRARSGLPVRLADLPASYSEGGDPQEPNS